MRTGLLAIGVALAVVGAILGVTGFILPGTTPSHTYTQTRAISAPNIVPYQDRVGVVSGVNTSSGTFSISWSSTQTLAVSLYQGIPCSSVSHYCMSGPALVSWSANASGLWTHSGALTFPFLLSLYNTHLSNTSFAGSALESYATNSNNIPGWAELTILAGAVLLVALGGMAAFLGLFLRRGVYDEPAPVLPRYPAPVPRDHDPLDDPFEDDADLESDGPEPPAAH